MGKITRRLLLGTAGAAVLGGVAYGGSRIACRFVPRNHPDFFSLLDIVPDDVAARRIGRLAIDADGVGARVEAIAATLAEKPLIREALATDCPTSRKALVQDACAADFADSRTVVVNGWVLSETEANLCAAKAIT